VIVGGVIRKAKSVGKMNMNMKNKISILICAVLLLASCSKTPSQKAIKLAQKKCELKSKFSSDSKEYKEGKKLIHDEFTETLRGLKNLAEIQDFNKVYYEELSKCPSKNDETEEPQEVEQAEVVSALEIAKLFDKDQAVFSSKWDGKKVILTDVMVNYVMDLTKRDKTLRHIEGGPIYIEGFNGKNIEDQSGSQEFVATIDGKDYQVYRTMVDIVLTDPSEIEQYRAPYETSDKGDYIKVSGNRKSLKKVSGKLDQKDGKLILKDAHIIEFGSASKQETTDVKKSSNTQNEVVNKKYFKIQDPDGYSNLRSAPNGKIIKKVYDTEVFEIIGTEGKFKKVKLADGNEGFIHQSRIINAN
jgi:hypothetical protein